MRLLYIALVLLALQGCGKPKPTFDGNGGVEGGLPPAVPVEGIPSVEPATVTPAAPDIGDAEFRIACALTLPPERDPAWTIRELKDHKGKIAMVTADLPSVPATLPVVCTVTSDQDFPDTLVAVRARLLRETSPGQQQDIGAFSTIASAQQPTSMTFDALKDLPVPPPTMLLTVELTLLMAPPCTDPATIDPATLEVAPEFRAVEMSNPLRINFASATVATEPVHVAQ